MSRELMERINNCNDGVVFPSKILADCKAEIQRLESELAKAREYVPMTDDEWETLYKTYEQLIYDPSPSPKYIEAEVVRRMKEQGLI